MKATLTRVGPYGVQTDKTGDNWVGGKFHKVNLKEFNVGNEVEIEYTANGKYLNLQSLTKLGEGTKSQAVVAVNGNKRYKTDPEDAVRMSRAAAVAAVFSSPVLVTQLQNTDLSQALSDLEGTTVRVSNYILNGKFSDLPLPEVTNESTN